ncbi:MAG: PKD domain-containing protein [Planctomycetales bacterium]|nr:PKD domain-containing protein [bacterium]UNM07958.1 MAG: PKD domain-containing protein [Planctomycetales bacterium]
MPINPLRFAPAVLLGLAAFFLSACAGSSSPQQSTTVPASGGISELPGNVSLPFPSDEGTERSARALGQQLVLGKDYFRKSADAQVALNAIQLSPAGAANSWAMFRFEGLTDSDVLQQLDVSFDMLPKDYYLAFADFDSGRWRCGLRGSANGGSADTDILTWPKAYRTVSPAGNAYIAVINGGTTLATLNSVILSIDFSNIGPLADLQASSIRGNASLTVDFDASASVDQDGMGQIALFEWDWDGDGSYDESGSEALVQHIFTEPGVYEVGLRVTDDNDGLTDTDAQVIRVLGWHHSIGTDEGEVSTSVNTVGNQVVGVGYGIPAQGIQFDANLFCFSELGEARWFRNWGDPDSLDQFYDIAGMPDDGFVAVGLSYGFNAQNGAVTIVRFDRNGYPLWQKLWDSSGNEYASGVVADTSGNIYVSGSSFGFRADSEQDAILLKLSADGDLLWQYRYTDTETTNPTGICFSGNDSVLLSTWADSYTKTRSVGLLEVNYDGQLIDQKVIEVDGIAHSTDIVVDRTGIIYISAYHNNFQDLGVYCMLVKLNASKAVTYVSRWGHEDEAQAWSLYLRYPALLGSPDVMVLGNSKAGSTYHPLLTRLNPNGTLDEAFSWFSPNGYYTGTIGFGPLGGIVLAGSAYNNNITYTGITPIISFIPSTTPAGTCTGHAVSGIFSDISGELTDVPAELDQERDDNNQDCFVGAYFPDDL